MADWKALAAEVEGFLAAMGREVDREIGRAVPREFTRADAERLFGAARYGYHTDALTASLSKPMWDLLDRGGKRWRPALFLLVAGALGTDRERVLPFAAVPEVIHNGTLILDDVEDDSKFRRGAPCVHCIHGVDIALNAGVAMLYLPMSLFIGSGSGIPLPALKRLYEAYMQEMINLSAGQGMDIAWHRGIAGADSVGEGQYLQMCAYKTGTLARLAARMGAILAGADGPTETLLGRYAEALGVAFQIQDDILNIASADFARKKDGGAASLGEDITEGKRTLMVIRTLAVAPPKDGKRLRKILSMHTRNQRLRNEAIAIMVRHGALEYAKEAARRMVLEAWDAVERVLPRSESRERLHKLTRYLVEREI